MKLIFASQASKHHDLGSLPFPLEDTRQTKQLKKETVARNGSWDDQTHVDKTGETHSRGESSPTGRMVICQHPDTYSIDFDRLHQTRLCQQKVYCQRCTYNLQCGERGA